MLRKTLVALIWIAFLHATQAVLAKDETISIPVLRQDAARGDTIKQEDLRFIDVPSRRTRGNIAIDASEIIGYAAKRRLKAGQMLRLTDVEVPALVEKNALVTMVLRYGAMTLSMQGRAQDRGAEGDYIRIINPDSHQIIEGQVIAPNLVEIAPPARFAQNAGS